MLNNKLVLHNPSGLVFEKDFDLAERRRPDVVKYRGRDFVFHRTKNANAKTEYWYFQGETLEITEEQEQEIPSEDHPDRKPEEDTGPRFITSSLVSRTLRLTDGPHQDLMLRAADEIDALRDALFWCGGSPSFGPGGEAEEGWRAMVEPLFRMDPETPS